MRAVRASVLAILIACSNGKSTADTASGDSGTTPPTTPTDGHCNYPATWQGVQDFFVVNCDRCHVDNFGQGHLDLRQAVEDDVANGGGVIVQPGDADASDLWRDIAGKSLLPMPYDKGQLPHAEICHVEQWIDAGASLE
jgi:hypothetical protein